MDAIESVVSLVRENNELREQVESFESSVEQFVGKTVTLRINEGRKIKFYTCIIDQWNGEEWELSELDSDDPKNFTATLEDLIEGRLQRVI
jgi:hypothetical protein